MDTLQLGTFCTQCFLFVANIGAPGSGGGGQKNGQRIKSGMKTLRIRGNEAVIENVSDRKQARVQYINAL